MLATHPIPVPAVRLIITDTRQRVLVLKRSQGTYAEGQWCLPGGKIDYGDTVEQAARRELKEETDLDCTALQFLFYQDSLPFSEKEMHCINFYFTARVSGDIRLNRESTDHAFIRPDELAAYRLAFRNDEGLARFWKQ
ncbi:NUDIX hydrolase [Desulfotignum balticum]|uniref:NUDIX hydrolase n=1 Tax=Desulfotignum balticum TaxID=115781 RepID=UPI000402A930|nr:NUDIX domain-containing protein [Desulfotignum balticum]